MLLVAVVLLAGAAALPPAARLPLQRGMEALDKNEIEDARINFEQASKMVPRNASVWLLLAQTYAKLKNAPLAAAAATKAEAFGSADSEIVHGLIHFYVETQRDLARAVKLETACVTKNPKDAGRAAELRTMLANEYVQKKDWANATQQMTSALQLTPQDEGAHFRLAQLYLFQEKFGPALSVLESAQKQFASSAQISLALGVTYYGLRKFPEAVQQFLLTTRLAPDVPQGYVFLGRILEHAGDRLPEVTERFAQLQARRPNEYIGYLLHGKALLSQEDTEGAFAALRRAVELQPKDADAQYQLGLVLEKKEQYDDAALHLEQSIQLNGKDPAPHFRLSRVYQRLGRKQEAAEQRAIHEKLSEQAAGEAPK